MVRCSTHSKIFITFNRRIFLRRPKNRGKQASLSLSHRPRSRCFPARVCHLFAGPVLFKFAPHSRRIGVLRLDPMRRAARTVNESRHFDTIPSSPSLQACSKPPDNGPAVSAKKRAWLNASAGSEREVRLNEINITRLGPVFSSAEFAKERNRIKRGTPFYDPEPGVILGIPKSVVE